MNVHRWKGLSWICSFALGGALAWTVYDFLMQKAALEQHVSKEEQEAVLQSVVAPPVPKEDVVDYNQGVRPSFINLNWTGKPPPPPAEVAKPSQVQVPKDPIEKLLSVLVIQVDTTDPKGSLAYVRYIDANLIRNAKKAEDSILREGEKLAAPHDYASVGSITLEGVQFKFEDANRPAELVRPLEYASTRGSIVKVGPG